MDEKLHSFADVQRRHFLIVYVDVLVQGRTEKAAISDESQLGTRPFTLQSWSEDPLSGNVSRRFRMDWGS